MACDHPMRAYQSLATDEEGKTKILWKNTKLRPITKGRTEEMHDAQYVDSSGHYYKLIMLPCGKCAGCKLDYAKELTKRVSLEARGKETYFVTFTYDEYNVPLNIVHSREGSGRIMTLVKAHARKMLNQIQTYWRKKGIKIKYILAGEYGSHSARPHYHAILINIPIRDLKPLEAKGKNGILYSSEWLQHYWKYGDVVIARANDSTIAYTAQYCLKKVGKEMNKPYIEPEFLIQSRNLGKDYILEHAEQLKLTDNVIISGHPTALPKKADDLLETSDKVKDIRKKLQVMRNQRDTANYESQQDYRIHMAEQRAIAQKGKLRNKL